MIEFKMPALGADMEDGTLCEWRKKPGDIVERGDIIAEVETQKGLIEIEAFDEGVIEELLIEEGAKVPVGTVMAFINPDGETVSGEKASTPSASEESVDVKASPAKPKMRIKATPLARKMAKENKIELESIKGTGEFGAITKEDVENSMVQQSKKAKEDKTLEKESVEKNIQADLNSKSIRMAVAAAMSKSNQEIPHYYLETKVDMRRSLAWLKEANTKRSPKERLLPAALYIKAVAKALDEHPELNAVWNDGLQLKNEINIGFVVSLRTGGLIVPAIRQADVKNVDEIMETLNDIIPRARAQKLRSSELSASTITITSLGEGGVEKVFGVIYPPQVAILGFGSIVEQAFAENGMLDVRPVMNLTLAGDHRANDGLTGSRFLTTIKSILQNPEAL